MYGTATEKSDYDFVAITSVPTKNQLRPDLSNENPWETTLLLQPVHSLDVYEEGDLNVAFYSLDHFMMLVIFFILFFFFTFHFFLILKKLEEHRIMVLELLYVPKSHVKFFFFFLIFHFSFSKKK